MPKVLTITPKEGESIEEFSTRVTQQVSTFFGEAAASTPSEEVIASPPGSPTPEGASD